jgi:hypothetical protein
MSRHNRRHSYVVCVLRNSFIAVLRLITIVVALFLISQALGAVKVQRQEAPEEFSRPQRAQFALLTMHGEYQSLDLHGETECEVSHWTHSFVGPRAELFAAAYQGWLTGRAECGSAIRTCRAARGSHAHAALIAALTLMPQGRHSDSEAIRDGW